MNAQEALNEIKELLSSVECEDDNYQMRPNTSLTNPLGGYQETSTIKSKTLSFDEFAIGLDDNEKALLAKDQSNAKPKTLEELGWEKDVEFENLVIYENTKKEDYRGLTFHKKYGYISSFTHNKNGIVNPATFTYADILAIAEKMKELGMTGEQIAKGETK